MRWYSIDEGYLNYLRSHEGRIPFIDYGDDKFKPFFGSLFEIGDLVYVTQVSHPQNRHKNLPENVDFYKLYRGDKLVAVVNLNYIFPVSKDKLTQVNYATIDELRRFESHQQKSEYIGLLKFELKQIKKKQINVKAQELYFRKHTFPNDTVSKRCLDFKNLEYKARIYECGTQD